MKLKQDLGKAKAIADRLFAAGATHCMLVGGFVRDHLMGLDSKDIDIEVYGLGYDQILGALANSHHVGLVGQSFGVVKVDNEIDVSIPRRESKMGVGHRGFDVRSDPTMTPHEAAARRDFTINSMGMTFDGNIFDPYGGQEDLRAGILRATTAAFKEDPLRVLRGMQFAARFGFEMDDQTVMMCRELVEEFTHLTPERVWEEWHKWAVKGRYPSKGLKVLEQTGWVTNFPILKAMIETPQDPDWHPEGDVFVHTGHVCDVAVDIADRERFDAKHRAVLIFAALCHDFGKTTTTARNDRGRWIAYQHSDEGVPLAQGFLDAMRAPGWLIDMVLPLVGSHMVHVTHPQDSDPSLRVVRRLAMRLDPATIQLWAAVCEADASGRPPLSRKNPVTAWQRVAAALALQDSKPTPLLLGRHLIPLGYPAGPQMGTILKSAFEAQLDGEIATVEDGIHWVQRQFPLVARS